MSAPQEANESLADRARRILKDNPEPQLQHQQQIQPPLEGSNYTELIELRLRAIRLLRELEPKRACFGARVRELSRSLAETPGESIHYRSLLERLREAHGEWVQLEERLWAATYVVRSTQWLVDLLSAPTGPQELQSVGEVASTYEP